MPTMDEQKMQDEYFALSGTYKTGGYDGQGTDVSYMAGFLAGHSTGVHANQQSVIEAIADLMRTDEQLAVTVDGWNDALDALKKQLEASNG